MSTADFYPVIEKGIIGDLGTIFYINEVSPYTSRKSNNMATYFVPEKNMGVGSTFQVTYPSEIKLPGCPAECSKKD